MSAESLWCKRCVYVQLEICKIMFLPNPHVIVPGKCWYAKPSSSTIVYSKKLSCTIFHPFIAQMNSWYCLHTPSANKAWFMKCRCVTTICPNPPETGRNNYILAQAAPWVLAAKPFRNICRVEGMAVSGTVTSYNPHKAIKLRGLGRNTDCNKWNLIGSLLCIWVFYLLLELWSLQISCLATSWYILLKLANLTFSACTGPASTSWGPVTTLVGIVLKCLIFYDAVSLQNASSGMSRQQLHTSPRCKCIPQGMWCAVL